MIAAVALASAPWHLLRFYSTPFAWLAALPLFGVGIHLYRGAHIGFTSAQLAGRPELEASQSGEQRLVTTGIRSHVRHPIYLAHFCELLAWAIGTGLVVICVLLVFAVFTGAVMIRMEERELEHRFGDEYREYKQRVPAIVPAFRRNEQSQLANGQKLGARS
jgi:protein-S-isoprenylcysteine O-methyltransferase Ste14